MSVSKHWVLGE